MYKATRIARKPRERFMRAVENEFLKFERKERGFRKAEREERAAIVFAYRSQPVIRSDDERT